MQYPNGLRPMCLCIVCMMFTLRAFSYTHTVSHTHRDTEANTKYASVVRTQHCAHEKNAHTHIQHTHMLLCSTPTEQQKMVEWFRKSANVCIASTDGTNGCSHSPTQTPNIICNTRRLRFECEVLFMCWDSAAYRLCFHGCCVLELTHLERVYGVRP